MAVKIRLKRMGAKKAPSYRVVVADSRYPRDGRFIEELGYYNPLSNPVEIKIDTEKAKAWISKGAQPTETARSLLKIRHHRLTDGVKHRFWARKQLPRQSLIT